MRRVLALLTIAAAMLFTGMPGAKAVNPDEMLQDPVLEARARQLGQELRCLVCQNQSIDDSNADLAHDLRLLVRERLTAGDSDAEVIRYLRSRYGDYVMLRPPVEPATLALWYGPFVVLAVGIASIAVLVLRNRSGALPAPIPLTPDEHARIVEVLSEDRRPDVAAGPGSPSL